MLLHTTFESSLKYHRLLSQGQCTGETTVTPLNSQKQQSTFHGVPLLTRLVPSDDLCSGYMVMQGSAKPSNKLHPFATDMAFGSRQPRTNKPSGRLGFILHTVTSFHRPRLHHYYGIICHLTSLRSALSYLLNLPIPATTLAYGNNIRLPRLRLTPCEQSHPQAHYGTDQVSGFALFWTLTLP